MFRHEDVYIRAVEKTDLIFLAMCRNDESTWVNLGSINLTNSARQRTWWEVSSNDQSQNNFVLCSSQEHKYNERIGFVRMDEIDHINKSIRIGGDIHPDFRGKGYGTKMYKLLFKYCFDQLNMHRIWLLVLDFNKPAINLYKKMHMKKEGRQRQAIFRNGKYRDYIMMSILRSEWKED